MSLLNEISNDVCWQKFLEYKTTSGQLSKKELEALTTFIEKKEYIEISNSISSGTYEFSTPRKIIISKMGKSKKRIVYSYNNNENLVLKLISYLLYKYDYLFSPNVYSFRQNIGVKKAIYNLTRKNNLNVMYGYKLDISNYFNSVTIPIILKNLKNDLNDENLYDFFFKLLSNPYVEYSGKQIAEGKGIMAGIPISAFLANYYLKDMDAYFHEQNIIYARYADDIIVFAKTETEIKNLQNTLHKFIEKYKLKINPEKEHFYKPGEKFDFLGFSYQNGVIDLSDNTIKKIKGKIRRSARGIRRWMIKNNAKEEYALKAMSRKYNRKFYGKDEKDLTWKYWFFPVINTTKSLKEVDLYMQDYLRFIATGKHNKKNFEKVPYKKLKDCNYRPLVHEYYLK